MDIRVKDSLIGHNAVHTQTHPHPHTYMYRLGQKSKPPTEISKNRINADRFCHLSGMFIFQQDSFLAYYLSEINISQASVATRLTCGGIFNDGFTANFLETMPVKIFIWFNINTIFLIGQFQGLIFEPTL